MTLQSDLQAIQAQATHVLRGERRRAAWSSALTRSLLLGCLVAVLALAYVGLAWLANANWPALSPYVVAGAALLIAAIALVVQIQQAAAGEITGGEALAAIDEQQGLKDRLQTAGEFLHQPHRSMFEEAAVLDAVPFAERARQNGLEPTVEPDRFPLAARGYVLLLVVLVLGGRWLLMPDSSVKPLEQPDKVEVADLDPERDTRTDQPRTEPDTPRTEETTTPREAQVGQRTAARKGKKDSQLSSEIKKTKGTMGAGQSADAASASGASQARGAASNQAQTSKANKKPGKSKKKKKNKKPKKPDSEPTPPKKPEEDSGHTAGRGAASGSNKSPSASPWSSKDQVTSDDEEDLEDDEEVDDEFDNSDARGGVQPHLRDRRPPVNRDLGIGFGNQKNPDANGRGGPSELKKSRGVASLVLGVPIPDHVKGRPNPGKTKITQERVEPKVEEATAVKATPRPAREAPVGHVNRFDLEPWMRDLIRSYYRFIRPKPSGNPSNPSPKKNSGD